MGYAADASAALRRDPDAPGPARPAELLALAALLAATMAAFGHHLGSVLVSDMDEGTYVYAGRLVVQGLVPYRDFMLAHPPLIALLVAGWCRLFGAAIVPIRLAYTAAILLGTSPLYAIVRRVSASHRAGLLAVASYTSGMLLVANMGRTVRLEPLMNAFVIAAFACRFLRPRSSLWAGCMGALLAAGVLVKLVAVVPAALLLAADVLWDRPSAVVARRWGAAVGGGALALAPAVAFCFDQPRFVQDVLLGQVNRPRIDLSLRLHYLAQNVLRDPPIAIGLCAAAFYVLFARDARIRNLGAVALGSSLVLFFAFRTFFNYYIVQALPWIAGCFGVAIDAIAARLLKRAWGPLSLATAALLGVAAPLGYVEVYERRGSFHVAGPRTILPILERGDGYLYSMYVAFGLWSDRPVYPWYYRADSLVARINGWIGDADFVRVFEGSNALVLWAGELDGYPRARAYVDGAFERQYQDADWSVWVRRRTATPSDVASAGSMRSAPAAVSAPSASAAATEAFEPAAGASSPAPVGDGAP